LIKSAAGSDAAPEDGRGDGEAFLSPAGLGQAVERLYRERKSSLKVVCSFFEHQSETMNRKLANSGFSTADPQREFAFSEDDFAFLAALACERAGIALSDSKRNLVYGRLSRRLRALGLTPFGEYREYLQSGDGGEIERFINSISTNYTRFFREAHHFAHFRHSVVKTFARQDQRRAMRRLRVWSAGCSAGEEPYTIALVLRREIADARHDVRILATDIDTDVLARASRANSRPRLSTFH
jgi:chemotaxis protein methyltransferase CheR